jgi:hypothetical protein
MVRKMTDNGGRYHEPPYTEEEVADLYRRTGNVVSVLRCPKSEVAPSQKSPKPQREE